MTLHSTEIMEKYHEIFGLTFPEGNLYDGNYETVNFTLDELLEYGALPDGYTADEDVWNFTTHQYLVDDEILYILTTDEMNENFIASSVTDLTTGITEANLLTD